MPERREGARRRAGKDAYLDAKVNDDEIFEAAKLIQPKWRNIGRILGPDPKFQDHDLFAFSRERTDRDSAQKMLNAWANKHHTKATRRELIEAMQKEEFQAQAEKIFGELKEKNSKSKTTQDETDSHEYEETGEDVLDKETTKSEKQSGVKFFWLVPIFILIVVAFGVFLLPSKKEPNGKTNDERLFTGADVTMAELILVIPDIGKSEWEKVALKIGLDFGETEALRNDHPGWSSSLLLNKVLSDFKKREGDSEQSRQRLIDACNAAFIGGDLRDAIKRIRETNKKL